MNKNIKLVSVSVLTTLALVGCGGEDPKAKQISELQERVIQMEKQIGDLQSKLSAVKNNSESIQYLNPKVQRMHSDLQKIVKSISTGQAKIVNTTKSFETPEQLKQAEEQIASQPLSVEHQKMVALIRSYLTTTPMKEIPQKLNATSRFHPDDGSKWDDQKLTRFIELYKIPKEVKPAP